MHIQNYCYNVEKLVNHIFFRFTFYRVYNFDLGKIRIFL